jgi:hypothetical protein
MSAWGTGERESSHYLETGVFRGGDLVSDPTLRWARFEVVDLLE